MISYISGIYAGHSTDAVVIECGGIGFCIRGTGDCFESSSGKE